MVGLETGSATDYAGRLLGAAGASPDNARVVAEHLVGSDARGVHSHGLLRVPQYVAEMERGEIDGRRDADGLGAPRRAASRSTAGGAFGQVSAQRAIDEAAAAAERLGIGLAATSRSGHAGPDRRLHRGARAARLHRARVLQRAAERALGGAVRRRRGTAGHEPDLVRARDRRRADRRRLLDQHAPRGRRPATPRARRARAARQPPGRRGHADDRSARPLRRAARDDPSARRRGVRPQGIRPRACSSRR